MARTPANNADTAPAAAADAITIQPAAVEPQQQQSADLAAQIGTITYARAAARFGKERALAVMKRVAEIGGHGHFEDEELTSPMFGGLAMPNPETVAKPEKEEFASIPDEDAREFYYQEALGQYKLHREKASADLAKINEYYNSLQ
jgi:hypothetical protein